MVDVSGWRLVAAGLGVGLVLVGLWLVFPPLVFLVGGTGVVFAAISYEGGSV
jgi:hypothetical protein